ncbi:hypothetical protein FNV43_RR08379 [Rhamnella rubrinervis]|uniref:Ubiquitin-like protease family profile domain-containing protein n=1 Tax=Rhamnella rubrinervis TaxID=2594499 RepID=A0A8K0H834_9ROSA|nr:hypothetical protein FNV43_RR08379 [Rhamnella rubrinervis]
MAALAIGPLLLDHFMMRTCRRLPAICRSSSQSDQVIEDRIWRGPTSAVAVTNISCDGDCERRSDRQMAGPAQIVHPNTDRQIAVECDDKYVMEFDFNGIGARFDRKCFAMITGLNCAFEDLDFDEKEVADNVKSLYSRPPNPTSSSPLPIDGTKDASQSAFQHTSRLEMQIEEIRSELVSIRTEMRDEMRQQRNEIQNLSSLVRQLVDHLAPILESALSAFIDDPSTTVHPGDYDALEKSSFQLILTSGSWLGDLKWMPTVSTSEEDDKLSSNAITSYCHRTHVLEQSKHRVSDEEEDELSDTVDWEKEMKDSPFDMYALDTPNRIKVYVPVNNDNKHWLAAKVDIRNRTVTLYDPNNSMTQDSFQCKNAKCLSMLFPYLLMVHGYYDLYPELKVEGPGVEDRPVCEVLLHHFVWSNTRPQTAETGGPIGGDMAVCGRIL